MLSLYIAEWMPTKPMVWPSASAASAERCLVRTSSFFTRAVATSDRQSTRKGFLKKTNFWENPHETGHF